jgi:hypothetical protein
MDATTFLKFKNLNNPNQYGLDMWRSASFTTLKDRVEALQSMNLPEAKECFADILAKYNARSGSAFDNFKFIPANLVVDTDLTIMSVEMLERLQHVVSARELQAELVNATANALGICSPQEVMRTIVNGLIFAKLHPGEVGSRADAVYIMDHQPSFEDVHSIGLDAANLKHVLKVLEIPTPSPNN